MNRSGREEGILLCNPRSKRNTQTIEKKNNTNKAIFIQCQVHTIQTCTGDIVCVCVHSFAPIQPQGLRHLMSCHNLYVFFVFVFCVCSFSFFCMCVGVPSLCPPLQKISMRAACWRWWRAKWAGISGRWSRTRWWASMRSGLKSSRSPPRVRRANYKRLRHLLERRTEYFSDNNLTNSGYFDVCRYPLFFWEACF